MKVILGIETSCDETACAIVTKLGDRLTIASNVIASSAALQAKYGGVIPDQAAREQLKSIIPVITEAIHDSRFTIHDIDAIAVTMGPGLIGSLLVGVETAKVLSLVWKKPLIPINHLLGHFYANWVNQPSANSTAPIDRPSEPAPSGTIGDLPEAKSSVPTFPAIGLLVSGGHSDIILMKGHGDYEYLGGTRDDAAGECFDKSARLMGLSGVQGGPLIAEYAKKGNPKAYNLPRPMAGSSDLDYSFSGLKTALLNLVHSSQLSVHGKDPAKKNASKNTENQLADLCASLQEAIVDTLVSKAVKAARMHHVEQIILSGGVAANLRLREKLQVAFHGTVFAPPPSLCTDNAVMIAASGFFSKSLTNPLDLEADPNLSLQ